MKKLMFLMLVAIITFTNNPLMTKADDGGCEEGYCGDGIVQEDLGEECEADLLDTVPNSYVCVDCKLEYRGGGGMPLYMLKQSIKEVKVSHHNQIADQEGQWRSDVWLVEIKSYQNINAGIEVDGVEVMSGYDGVYHPIFLAWEPKEVKAFFVNQFGDKIYK